MAIPRTGAVCLALALVGLGLARPAHAAPPGDGAPVEAPASRPLIAGGEAVVTCAWPSAVAVSGGAQCSGVLVHPRVVVYAAHCGGGTKTIRFGESSVEPARSVATERCQAYPNYAGPEDQGHDFAYCILAEAIDELPPTPPLFGCETEVVEVGREVALVGYGATLDMPGGTKHWAMSPLVAVTPGNNTSLVGDPNLGAASICSGDSGGPALVALDDGSWRVLGIASTVVGACGGYGAHAMLPAAVAWIEFDSGVDITPCHAADGSWAPGPSCTGANAQSPNVGTGTWDDWCAGTATAGPSRSCGPAWDEFDPSALPSVAIASPADGATFLFGAQIEVAVEASKDPEGFALAHVELEVDGQLVALDDNDPWLFPATTFPDAGVHTLVAIAEDWAGNRVASAPIEVGYGADPGTDGGGSDTTDSGVDAGLDDAGQDDDTGCSCAATPEGVAGSAGSCGLLLAFWWLRRRRSTIGS